MFFQSINDLRNRLKNTRPLTPPLEGAAWTYGISGTFLKTHVLDYWVNKYDYPKQIAHLNKYPQFITNIQGKLTNRKIIIGCSHL